MSGRVAHGDKIGRTIGIPTANIHLHRNRSPLQGIFVTELYGIGAVALPGVASIGTRPGPCWRCICSILVRIFTADTLI
jgi:riboflavin kinase/FMN adenylyltransferase